MFKQPLAEVFGFPVDNGSSEAERYRQNRLCPYNNKVPNCTKDSVTNPLGICSIFHGEELAITCPVRLRQDWMIAEHAASFFFPSGTRWTTLLEVRLMNRTWKMSLRTSEGKSVAQSSLFPEIVEEQDRNKIVNVASVPQRSPFRYPGGKTWLVPHIRKWLASRESAPNDFIEPFAGGGIVGLTVAAEHLADHVTMVELDEQVAAVWRTILEGDGRWLSEKITSFDLTPESLEKELAKPSRNVREMAFQTILKNRIFHGGILAAGSAPLKYGENGKGVRSRWYPETLKKRILAAGEMKDRLSFIHGDGFEVIKDNADSLEAVFFVDPPYTAPGKSAGRRLYKYFDIDHEELFSILSRVAGEFLITYDDAGSVRNLADRYGFDTELIPMKNTHHAEMTELLIGRNLDWARV